MKMNLNLAQKILEDKEYKKNMAKELQQLLNEEMKKLPAQRDYQKIEEITRTYCMIMNLDDWVKEASARGIQDVLNISGKFRNNTADQSEKINESEIEMMENLHQDEPEEDAFETEEHPIIQHTRVFHTLLTAAACLLICIGGTTGIYMLNRFPQSDSAQPVESSTESFSNILEFSSTETTGIPSAVKGTETTAQSNPATTSVQSGTVTTESETLFLSVPEPSETTVTEVTDESVFTKEIHTSEEENIISTTTTTIAVAPEASESLSSSEAIQTSTAKKLTIANIIVLAKKGDNLTWADFDQYQSEDISSGQYMLKYEIADDDEHYILVCGENTEGKPDRILLESDSGMSMDIRSEEFQWFQLLYWLSFGSEPENDEVNQAIARQIGEYALTELHNGTYTTETRISVSDASELMHEEIAELYRNSVFYRLSFVDEHTVLLRMNKGLIDAYGYLITDDNITYSEGDCTSVPDEGFYGDAVYVEWAGDHLYYFHAEI